MSTSTAGSNRPDLVRFYHAEAPDSRGRTLAEILSWSDSRLESSHDYIQVLFPLPEPSPVNWSAPVIDEETFNAFRSRPELRASLARSFARMLAFYGLQSNNTNDIFTITKASNYETASRNWVTRFDHNHLRITRIIRSLRVLGLEMEARAFYVALQDIYNRSRRISGRSMMFWSRAMERPLNIAPEDEDGKQGGADFLLIT